jgi:transcriptional regulator with XRE-family HTH domain
MARTRKTKAERAAEAALRAQENAAVAGALRRLRSATDLDQHEAAYRSNLHRAQYGHYEQGRNAVSFVNMLYVADGLGVSIEDIADAVRAELPKRPRRDRA